MIFRLTRRVSRLLILESGNDLLHRGRAIAAEVTVQVATILGFQVALEQVLSQKSKSKEPDPEFWGQSRA